MELAETLLNFDAVSENKGFASAVIVAAGSSTRMGGVSKQLMTLGGIPVIARTLLAFERAENIKDIVVVTRESDILSLQMIAQKYMITKLCDIIAGGDCREESVKNGINRLDANTEYVLIHDGARPLITPQLINNVALTVREKKAVACAVPVKDTIKVVSSGIIEKTLDRASLFAVQTPQAFAYKKFKECINADIDLSLFTDDCAIAENFGIPVAIMEGDYNNLKITTKEDIVLAENILNFSGDIN